MMLPRDEYLQSYQEIGIVRCLRFRMAAEYAKARSPCLMGLNVPTYVMIAVGSSGLVVVDSLLASVRSLTFESRRLSEPATLAA
jgi:hypothetical protein